MLVYGWPQRRMGRCNMTLLGYSGRERMKKAVDDPRPIAFYRLPVQRVSRFFVSQSVHVY
jgi:hypothetical protein